MQIRMRAPASEAPRMRIHMRMLVQEDPRMRIHMRMLVQEDPGMRIHMRMLVQEDPGMRIPVSRYPRTRMRTFVTYLNNTSYCQMGAAFVTEYRLLHYTEY